jgi:hypothetical protein
MNIEDDQSDHVRDVYAHFGLALYIAQVLEHALVNAMVAGQLPGPARMTRQQIDDFMETQFDEPLGRLIQNLRRHVHVPEELNQNLRQALNTRNRLAHRYFRERARDFMSAAGRSAMIEELEAARDEFDRATSMLDSITHPIMRRFGVTDDKVAEYERRFLAEQIDG